MSGPEARIGIPDIANRISVIAIRLNQHSRPECDSEHGQPSFAAQNFWFWEGVAMTSSGRIRLLVCSLFFVALIAFAIPYSPTNALSRPAQPGDSAVMPTGTPLKIKAPLGLPPVSHSSGRSANYRVGCSEPRTLLRSAVFRGHTISHPAILRNRVYRHSLSLDWGRRQKTYAALADRHQLRL